MLKRYPTLTQRPINQKRTYFLILIPPIQHILQEKKPLIPSRSKQENNPKPKNQTDSQAKMGRENLIYPILVKKKINCINNQVKHPKQTIQNGKGDQSPVYLG
jgi:hypothetical protein